jgi:hypothetical protein
MGTRDCGMRSVKAIKNQQRVWGIRDVHKIINFEFHNVLFPYGVGESPPALFLLGPSQ